MANLSQQKRQRMLEFLQTIRDEHKDDDDVLIALGEIESELNAKNTASCGSSTKRPLMFRCAITFPYLLNVWIRKSQQFQVGSCMTPA